MSDSEITKNQSLSFREIRALGMTSLFAMIGFGAIVSAVVEGRAEDQLDQAHHLQLDELPPHLQEWQALQARQKEEEDRVEVSHNPLSPPSRIINGATFLMHTAEDAMFAAKHLGDLAHDVKEDDRLFSEGSHRGGESDN